LEALWGRQLADLRRPSTGVYTGGCQKRDNFRP